MSDRADGIARKLDDSLWSKRLPDRLAALAAALRSYASEIEAELDQAIASVAAITTDRDRLAKEVAGLETSVALACDSANIAIEARDRSEDRARQSEAELVAMTAERDRLRATLTDEACGWAVVSAEGIAVRTISDTRRAAIVNWLVTAKGFVATYKASDALIESMWIANKDGVEAVEVSIRARAALYPPTPEGGGG